MAVGIVWGLWILHISRVTFGSDESKWLRLLWTMGVSLVASVTCDCLSEVFQFALMIVAPVVVTAVVR